MRTITLLLMLLSGLTLQAQQFNFRNWSLEQGLPQSQVNDVLQDHKGQLWVATLGGLSRFDGNIFHTYTKSDGLNSNSINCLFQDSKRHIWIGTSDSGLIRFTGSKFKFYGPQSGLPAGGIYDITEDNKGIIWVATDSGIHYFSEGRFITHDSFPPIRYNAVLASPTHELWAGSASQGVFKLTSIAIVNYTSSNSSLPDDAINVLSQAPTGTIWIGSRQGVSTFRHNKLSTLPLPPGLSFPDVTDFTTDTYGHQWFSMRNKGVLKYDGKHFQHMTRYSGLRTDKVNALTTDIEGNIWIGTSGQGLMQYRNPWFIHYFDMGQVKEPVISALAQDTKGRVWIGTDDGYAAYLEDGILNWLKTDIWPVGTTLHSMWIHNENDVWVCTSQGLYRLGPDKFSHFDTRHGLPANEVYQAIPDQAGNLLLATAAGLAIMRSKSQLILPLAAAHTTGKVYVMYRDSKGRTWLGTENGVFQYENGTIQEAEILNATGFRHILTITEDKDGTLYFGGFNYGILMMHDDWETPKQFSSRNGLPNEGVKSLYVDKSNLLWVGTNRNVLRVRLDELLQHGRLSFRTYSNQDGFRGQEVSNRGITQTPDGTMWFATSKGLTMYLPEMDRRNRVYPHTVLTNIMLFLKPTDWEGLGYKTDSVNGLPVNLRLPHHQNHLTFDFHGISLTAPDKVRYRYRLKGHDEHWSSVTDQSFATYASLDPGTYTFQLLACNNDDYWTPSPLTYSFTIIPPIWRREWFIILLLLIAAGGAISIVRLRERSLIKLNTFLEQKVQHRTELLEEKNREKEILLKEIHHRVKNNLQIILSMLNLQARHVRDANTQEVMQSIRGRVRSMAILHERLYQHEDLASIDLHDYFKGICEGLYATYGVTQQQVRLELDVPPVLVEADTALSLGLILNELVSNTLKYAFPDRTGILRIHLQSSDHHVYTLTVSDNGVGLPPDFEARRKHSFGLKLVSSLIKKLNGKIAYNNNNGTNSILHFVLAS